VHSTGQRAAIDRLRRMHAPTLYRDFRTQAEIDAQYNAGAAVPDAQRHAQRWRDDALRARQTLRCMPGVPYGPTLAETLDIFPADRPGAPVFVFLHGGYWRAFGSADFSGIALGLVPAGITTVIVDYALAPKVTLDEIVRQARAAVAWTLRNIDTHGGDAARVAVGGHSAGGHLAAMCLATDWKNDYGLPADPIAAALLVSGLHDLAPLRYSYLQPQIQLDEGIVQRCSPLRHVRACATPVRLVWGADESAEFARQSQAYDTAWRAAGNASEALAEAGANHFTVLDALGDPAGSQARWLAGVLGVSG
jgi:arylformamidase